MASPQKENGYTAIANEILDALIHIRVPGEARQLLDFIIRKTYGFQKKEDKIAGSQIEKATGLSKAAIHKAREKLKGMGLITVTQKGTGQILTYGFTKDYHKWKPIPKRVPVPKRVLGGTQKGIGTGTQKVEHKRKKETITKEMSDLRFKEIWKEYPNKIGKDIAQRKFNLTVKAEKDWKDIQQALMIYLAHLKLNEWKKPQDGKTWFNNWRGWVDYREPGIKTPEEEKRERTDSLKKQIRDLEDNMEQEEIKEIMLTRGYTEQEIDEALGRSDE